MSTTTASTRTSNRAVAGVGIAALALAAVAAGVAYNAGQQNAPQAAPAASSSSASQSGSGTGTGTNPSTGGNSNKVEPSNAIKAIQQELGELNFYQGPINGYDTPATVAAVKNLQAQAGLPQTGHMNPQTRTALLKYLAQGSNNMNS
jgi:peptidoglycan hydrolase-like protein with peptidoglycan-binding domain